MGEFDNTLYVIFHGSMAFYDEANQPTIDLMLTNVNDDHVYIAGAFLGEYRIPRSSVMTLCGVDVPQNGGDSFAHYGVYRYTRCQEDHDTANEYSRLVFPRPQAIYLRRTYTATTAPNVPSEGNLGCLVVVFQYTFQCIGGLLLALDSHDDDGNPFHRCRFSWRPLESDLRPLSLHVWAEEDRAMPSDYLDRAYGKAALLLGQKDVPRQTGAITDGTVWDPSGFEDRFAMEVLMSLSERQVHLAALGRSLQTYPQPPWNRMRGGTQTKTADLEAARPGAGSAPAYGIGCELHPALAGENNNPTCGPQFGSPAYKTDRSSRVR